MARPRKELTDEQKAQVEALAAVLNAEQIADYLKIGRTTFFEIMDRDPEVSERYKAGKARAISEVANGLLMKARGGDTASMMFYLKTQAGWRETNRTEVTGADGGPIQTEDTGARDKLAALLARQSAAGSGRGDPGNAD